MEAAGMGGGRPLCISFCVESVRSTARYHNWMQRLAYEAYDGRLSDLPSLGGIFPASISSCTYDRK